MSLLTYKDARPWARAIATQVKNGTMPPWHADPAIGHFSNERRLTDAQKTTIARWVEAGAPEGDPQRPAAGAAATPTGWSIGQPDAVLEMQEDYPIPASGEIPYVYFEVPANYDEDRWVKAWEVRPGNPAVVHHVIVYLRPPRRPARRGRRAGAAAAARHGDLRRGHGHPRRPDRRAGHCRKASRSRRSPTIGRGRAARPDRSAASCPGNATRIYPDGTAMRLPKGASLVFQMHYTTDRQGDHRSHAHGPDLRQGAAEDAAGRHRARQRRAAHSRRRRQSPRRRRDDAQSRPAALQHDAAHPRPRHPLVLRGGLSRRPARAAALGAQLRLRVAARLRVRDAARTAGRHDDQGVGVVRQLAGEQVESRRHQGRLVGRSDLGRDDVHELHLVRAPGGADAA